MIVAVVTAVLGQLRVAHVVVWGWSAATAAILLQLPILDDARRASGTSVEAATCRGSGGASPRRTSVRNVSSSS